MCYLIRDLWQYNLRELKNIAVRNAFRFAQTIGVDLHSERGVVFRKMLPLGKIAWEQLPARR